MTPTDYDEIADVVLRGKAGEMLPAVLRRASPLRSLRAALHAPQVHRVHVLAWSFR